MPLPSPDLLTDDDLLPGGIDSQHTAELYRQVLPLHGPDPALLALDLCEAWAHGVIEIETLVRDSPQGSSWSIIFDVDLVPAKGLPWLALLRGAKLPAKRADQTEYQYETQCRTLIALASAQDRGTRQALEAAVRTTLVPTPPAADAYVKITERLGGDAYQLAVRTLTAETPSTAATLEAAQSQVPAGVVLDYAAVAGQSWDAVAGSFASWDLASAAYATWDDMAANLP